MDHIQAAYTLCPIPKPLVYGGLATGAYDMMAALGELIIGMEFCAEANCDAVPTNECGKRLDIVDVPALIDVVVPRAVCDIGIVVEPDPLPTPMGTVWEPAGTGTSGGGWLLAALTPAAARIERILCQLASLTPLGAASPGRALPPWLMSSKRQANTARAAKS